MGLQLDESSWEDIEIYGMAWDWIRKMIASHGITNFPKKRIPQTRIRFPRSLKIE